MGAYTRILPPHRRRAIRAEIDMHLERAERLIARLDQADGDPDLEDGDDDRCSAGDDAPIAFWGDGGAGDPADAEDEYLRFTPAYGLDQALGPVNARAVEIEERARVAGLVRTSTGGWRAAT